MEIRYRLSETAWQRLEQRLEALDYRAAIVGSHGRGKTTLLEDLGMRLERNGWRVASLHLSAERRHLGPIPPTNAKTIICCDGAEQLDWWSWRRLVRWSRSAGGLIVTTHRPGRLPTLHECETSPALLQEIVASLHDSVPAPRCDILFARHGGNLREAIRELYDEWSEELIS